MRFIVLCALLSAVASTQVVVDFDRNVALFNVSFTNQMYMASELCLHACNALPCAGKDGSLRLVALPMPTSAAEQRFVAPFEFGALSTTLLCAEVRLLENQVIVKRLNITVQHHASVPSLATTELITTDQEQTQAVLCFANLVQPTSTLCRAQVVGQLWEWPFAVIQTAGVSQRSQLVVLTPELLSNQPTSVKLNLIGCYRASNGGVFNVSVMFTPAMMAANSPTAQCKS